MFEFLYTTFVVTIVIQLAYYSILFSKFSFLSTPKINYKNLPVSIIICAKNEAKNLKQNLTCICKQIYTNFELILVNDHSTDDTLNVFKKFKKQYQNITILDLQNSKSNKKNALAKGIEKAKYNHLLLTDADCSPNSKNWISEMTAQFNKKKSIILGYGAYQKINKSWLNKLIRFETLLTAIQYFSYAKIGLPYMGVGRNITYTVVNFNKVNGFNKHRDIKSGDDDLFINEIANSANTAICFTKSSFTISKPHTNLKKWLHQKRRHITTANNYKLKHQFLLGLFFISQFLFWFLAIFLLISSFKVKIILVLVFIRISFQYLIFTSAAKKLHEKDLILFTPILELFLIIIQMYIFIQNLVRKPVDW
ncbi:MAG: glycosyltransferase [Flavobacteriaceae bacterium]|nr:glycosyltransferase [Flavobacteriaceae bacterium]